MGRQERKSDREVKEERKLKKRKGRGKYSEEGTESKGRIDGGIVLDEY